MVQITSQAIEAFLLAGRYVRSTALRFIFFSFSLTLLTNATTLVCGDEFPMNLIELRRTPEPVEKAAAGPIGGLEPGQKHPKNGALVPNLGQRRSTTGVFQPPDLLQTHPYQD
jgi:hypothetical protein